MVFTVDSAALTSTAAYGAIVTLKQEGGGNPKQNFTFNFPIYLKNIISNVLPKQIPSIASQKGDYILQALLQKSGKFKFVIILISRHQSCFQFQTYSQVKHTHCLFQGKF